jgi:hypothetical protein
VKNNPLKYTDPSGHVAWIPIFIIGAGVTFGATEALASYTLEKPNAGLQEKLLVMGGGAVLGGAGATAALFTSSSVIAAAAVGGISSGVQQAYNNRVAGKDPAANVLTEIGAGALYSGVVGGVVKKANWFLWVTGAPSVMYSSKKGSISRRFFMRPKPPTQQSLLRCMSLLRKGRWGEK